MSSDPETSPVIEFPLRGEWRVVSAPADHGTDFFGQRYAFDFARMDESGHYFYPRRIHLLLHLLAGLPAARFLCWGQSVHAAFSGHVVAAQDGWPDRKHVNALWELVRGNWLSRPPTASDYRPLTGNCVMIEGDPGVVMDGRDPLRAAGVRCAFSGYERFVEGCWIPVPAGVPGRFERIRAAAQRARS